MTKSRAELLAEHPDCDAILGALGDEAKAAMYRDWRFHARPEQLAPPGSWRWWAAVTGRGFGKNRLASEWELDRCEQFAAHGAPHLMGLMNATYSDVRALQIGGESGLEACAERRGHRVDIPRTSLDGRVQVWTPDGWHDTTVEIHTADQPDRVRGRNFHTLSVDEFAKWKHKVDREGNTAFTNADLGLRALCPADLNPQGCATSTPKPIQLVKDLLAGEYGRTVISRGSMMDNRANLAPEFIEAVLRRYLGSRLGSQEIEGLVLTHVEGALWDLLRLDATRLRPETGARVPELFRIVVGVDPSGGGRRGTCGIIVCGVAWVDGLPHLYVLEDASESTQPQQWARTAIDAYYRFAADAIVLETNFGYKMGVDLIAVLDPNVNVEEAHASRGKAVRAEPVAALWAEEQARAHLVGYWPELEEQLTTWVPGDDDSPDRLDALVWCGHSLLDDLTAIDTTRAYGSAVAEARY